MTIAPLILVLIIAIIITLMVLCLGFAMAWRRAEAEIALIHKQRAFRAIGSMATGEKYNG